MPRPRGLEKTGGRQKGTPNRSSLPIQELLNQNGVCVLDRIFELLPDLSVEKQVDTLIKLMPYVHPRRSTARELTETITNKPTVHIVLPDNGRSRSNNP